MRNVKKIVVLSISVLVGVPVLLLVILFAAGVYMYRTADFLPPQTQVDASRYELSVRTDSLRVCQNASLYLNRHGLWETRISGTPAERGMAYGILNQDLLEFQEDVFIAQIHELVPTEWWVEFLHKLIIVFDRNMAQHIPQEYREEIYAMSLSCTDKYNAYGSPYVRQLNYHAAHDIGHAMQEYMLVGCSSFAVWNAESATGGLLVARNFDFYVGDRFAKNKVVLFVEPTEGHRFVSISWPGMMGVLSGMNDKGLTVTINAAKGAIPTSSAMPISLLARHILQYAATIDEAYAIAQQFETFVSESLLIGSATDGYAAIIEKTPAKIALYQPASSRIVCTNHYQSADYATDKYNMENIATSDSPYRHDRINELLDELSPINTSAAVQILRNRYGAANTDIGLGNEKSINQFIAHHSVVFQPDKLRFWVSTAPWQSGEFVCYDLNAVFNTPPPANASYALEEENIAADSTAVSNECRRVCLYREQARHIKTAIKNRQIVTPAYMDAFIANNPQFFQVYNLLGDYMAANGHTEQAVKYWKQALNQEIPRTYERDEITSKIQQYD